MFFFIVKSYIFEKTLCCFHMCYCLLFGISTILLQDVMIVNSTSAPLIQHLYSFHAHLICCQRLQLKTCASSIKEIKE